MGVDSASAAVGEEDGGEGQEGPEEAQCKGLIEFREVDFGSIVLILLGGVCYSHEGCYR
jgi:hypothetical protein